MHVLRKTHVDWVVCEVGVDLEEAVHSDRPRLLGVRCERTFHILHVWVPVVRRGAGLARALLFKLAEACRAEGVFRLEVDDVSERHRARNNLYLSAGFTYDARSGPEMSATTRTVMRRTALLS